jgi:hypothetical protein
VITQTRSQGDLPFPIRLGVALEFCLCHFLIHRIEFILSFVMILMQYNYRNIFMVNM